MPLRVFLVFEDERQEFFIPDGATVADIRQEVKNRFLLGGDDGKPDIKVVLLNYLGAELKDEWNFQDIGVMPGATIRISEREEKKPRLYVLCSFNGEKIRIMEELEMIKTTVAEIRTIVSRLVGLPVGVFRLTTDQGVELYDCHTLDKYDLDIGDTIHLQTWDGWTDFLNLCKMGYTSHVFSQLSEDDLISRYQMKVAMHIACHFGHIDLVLNLMKQGVRADDPVGYHPYRQWCNVDPHISSLKPPIHECAEQGQTACIRSIVNHNITTISCKDGYGKTPFQVALMGKQKPTAGYLLGKQWSRIQYGSPSSGITLPLNIYSKLKNWCERAKDRNYLNNGPAKSTLKRRPYITMGGTLVGLGVVIDGYTPSLMNGKSLAPPSQKTERSFLILPSDKSANPKEYFKTLTNSYRGKQNRNKVVHQVSRGGRGRSELIVEEDAPSYGVKINQNRDTSLSRPEEATIAEEELLKKISDIRATNSRGDRLENVQEEPEFDTSKLPQLDRKANKQSFMKDGMNIEKEGTYIETGREDDQDRSKSRSKSQSEDKKDRLVISAMKKSKMNTSSSSIPLPLIHVENSSKPYIVSSRSKSDDPALSTLSLYERYRGLKARDYAIKCLSIASNFKDKPWLQQVQLAMDLTSQEVKKRARRVNSESFNSGAQSI